MSARESQRPGQLTPSHAPSQGRDTVLDFNLLSMVLQPAQRYLRMLFKIRSPKSYSADSARSEIRPRNLFHSSLVTWMEFGQADALRVWEEGGRPSRLRHSENESLSPPPTSAEPPSLKACGLVSFQAQPKSMFTPVSRKSEQRQTDQTPKLTLPPAKPGSLQP